jgi:DNA-3-methyladenine glycosylase II
MTPAYDPPSAQALTAAREALAAADPAIARLHAVTPAFEWRLRTGGFHGLTKLVIYQQVSLASAEAIWNRLETGLGEVSPEAVLAIQEQDLLPFGLSRPKARYVHALAASGFDFTALRGLDDAAATAALTGLLGIGRWTAETYLMFAEGRLDVFPAGDVALQEAMRWADGAAVRPTEKQAYLRAEAWKPYRGVAAHLLWACYGAVRRGEIPALMG